MKNNPLLTVGLSVYNAEKFLENCIVSILKQTFENFELIIINDGSTDSSDEIIKSFSDSRIRYYCFKDNLGLALRLNQIIELSQGEFFARVDSDDILINIRFEEQLKVLKNESKNTVCHSSAKLLDITGKEIGFQIGQNPLRRNHILRGNYPLHPTVMARTHWFKQNQYDIEMDRIEDMVLWYLTFQNTIFILIDKPLIYYRKGTTYSFSIHLRTAKSLWKFYKKYRFPFYYLYIIPRRILIGIYRLLNLKRFINFKLIYFKRIKFDI